MSGGTIINLLVHTLEGIFYSYNFHVCGFFGVWVKGENHNIRDRDFLLVDGNGKQLNMVNYPKMALIQTQVKSGDELTLSAPNMPDFTFTPPKLDANNKRTCK